MKIPITVVLRELSCGGAEQHLLHALPSLDRRRFDPEVIVLDAAGALKAGFVRQQIAVHSATPGILRVPSSLSLLSKQLAIRKPILHTFLPEPYLLGATTGLFIGVSALVMSRRSRNHYQSRHPVAAWVERRLHGRMDALLGNSRAVVHDLLDEGAPPERVRLIYNGIDPGRFAAGEARVARRRAVRAELGLRDDEVVLTCVANLFHYKGHADLLAALAMLGSGRSTRTTLLLVGRDAGARAALEAQSAQLGLTAMVRFLGERGDVPDLLAASDIGVLASHEEGFSNAVIEGMAAGLPMVVSDVGGNAEAVTDGECGLVVPARDPSALANALALLIGDSGRRLAMGEAARCRVAAAFSLGACVAAYEALYEELWDRRMAAARSE